jgi:hypothetical protein
MNVKSFALAAGVTLGALGFGSAAQAACCVAYDYNDAKQNTNQIISQLSERINAMQLAIIEAMRLGTGQLSGNSKEQIGAQSNMANVNDDRRVVGNIEMARFNAIKGAASGASSCNVMTGARAGSALGASAASLSAALSSDTTAWDLGSTDQMPSSQGRDVAIQKRLSRHCALYSNQDDVRSGLCSSAAGSDMQNASIDVGKSLFYNQAGSESTSLGSQRVEAAKTFLINAIAPNPQGGMLPKEATSASGREKAAQRQASAARLSIASNTVSDILAKRTAMPNSEVQGWAQSLASQISGYNANYSEGVSWHDWMDVRASGWYRNANWGVAMNNSYEQAIKDGVMIQSFQAYLAWETYKLIERQNLMLATMLSIQTESSRNIAPAATTIR